MSTPQADGQPSRKDWLAAKRKKAGMLPEEDFPLEGVENLCSFLEDSGFCGMEQGSKVGFTPQDVMSWETYLDRNLTQNERRAIIILSSNYATFYNRWFCKPIGDPYREFKESKGIE